VLLQCYLIRGLTGAESAARKTPETNAPVAPKQRARRRCEDTNIYKTIYAEPTEMRDRMMSLLYPVYILFNYL